MIFEVLGALGVYDKDDGKNLNKSFNNDLPEKFHG